MNNSDSSWGRDEYKLTKKGEEECVKNKKKKRKGGKKKNHNTLLCNDKQSLWPSQPWGRRFYIPTLIKSPGGLGPW